ncbi:hypothetical protein HOK68_05185 [Candidatus Woesearchaeota archaeon]|jgi:hypothetical protein|nr:hypothetical protein [Candidatus Woesearchaeota archaeon]MBT4387222.1 hypothetical protein [Candidatus Woesearchaeota archaeon]MBT4596224.1 hypothetical protein [Candidatus Woesearchaeota archaeon]MBT5741553.1 hypothetical protein [Candidatus Woesearchaeota archaeon]MBT6506143.1 hypothetical protein [Candidatus Woesearchaeota archaeon]
MDLMLNNMVFLLAYLKNQSDFEFRSKFEFKPLDAMKYSITDGILRFDEDLNSKLKEFEINAPEFLEYIENPSKYTLELKEKEFGKKLNKKQKKAFEKKIDELETKCEDFKKYSEDKIGYIEENLQKKYESTLLKIEKDGNNVVEGLDSLIEKQALNSYDETNPNLYGGVRPKREEDFKKENWRVSEPNSYFHLESVKDNFFELYDDSNKNRDLFTGKHYDVDNHKKNNFSKESKQLELEVIKTKEITAEAKTKALTQIEYGLKSSSQALTESGMTEIEKRSVQLPFGFSQVKDTNDLGLTYDHLVEGKETPEDYKKKLYGFVNQGIADEQNYTEIYK